MEKYIHAGRVVRCVGFIIYFISSFGFFFGTFIPMASAMAIAPHTCCSSVAFIPGLEASRLYVPGFAFENKLWEPDNNGDAANLFMDNSGNSVRKDIYTRDVIDTETVGKSGLFTAGDIYGNFVDFMDGLVTNKTIAEWNALPYDWRLNFDDVVNGGVLDAKDNISYLSSTTSNVSYMISQIQALANHSYTGKVTLVTHSNGGLVAKVLIQKLQDLKTQGQSNLIDKIDKVIMVAAPQLGSVDAVASLLHGYKLNYGFGYILSPNYGRAMAENMPAAYNLLPSQGYFQNIKEPIIAFSTSTDNLNNFSKVYGRTITNYDVLKQFLLASDGRNDPAFGDVASPNVLNGKLVLGAQNEHASLDTWQFPTNIEVDQVAGWGVDTLDGIEYQKKNTCTFGVLDCQDVLDTKPVFNSEGDGTVLYPSALSSAGQKYFVNIHDYNQQMTATGILTNNSHENILGIWSVQDLLANIFRGSSSLPQFVTTDEPFSSDKKLLVAAHSPILLDAYDSFGNHTGLIDNPDPNSDIQLVEQKIPNSFYTNFGEGKYLGIDADTSTAITFQGTDYGSFALDTTLSQGGNIIKTSTFVDIPVTPELKGSIINATSSTPVLSLDIDGDGTVDVVATSTAAFDPVLYLEIMKKTVDSFDLKKPAEKTLLQKLDQLETKIKKGKIANADKQLKKFIKKIQHNKKLKKINNDERNQLVQMLSNLVDNLL